MLRSNVRRQVGGFTLVESLVVVAIVGLLSAISIPSFLVAYQRAKLSQAVEMTIATLRATQSASVRRNQTCSLSFDLNRQTIDLSRACLPTADIVLPDVVKFTATGISDRVQYGMRGNTTTNKTIILGIKNSPEREKCITISAPLGIIRTGVYDRQNKSCLKS
jgi:prepilin-type N-terminal cleavage/methylation domain-containing protein